MLIRFYLQLLNYVNHKCLLFFICIWQLICLKQLSFFNISLIIISANVHLRIQVCFLHSFISIQPQRPGWQEQEHSHVTGTALAHCILGKFLGVVCYCFPPPLDVPTFAGRCLYVRNDARDHSSERWKCGREICPVILPKFRLPLKFRDLLHAANLRHGTDSFTSPPKEGVLRIFSP